MTARAYKYAFLAAAAACAALAAILGYTLWDHKPARVAGENSPIVARGPAAAGNPALVPAPSSNFSSALVPVRLDPQRMQAIGLKTAPVELRTVSNALRVPGNVDVNQRRVAYVQTRVPGWIQKVFVNAVYQYVRQGQPMFTVYSPDLVSTEQEYLLARANQKSFAAGHRGTAASESNWLLTAAADRLRQFGVPPAEIARLERTGAVQHEMVIEAPASGYVTEFNALPNQYVQAESRLYTIADLSTVWVNANVFQNDVGGLRPGARATVTVDAYPGRTFNGRIEQILPRVDATTRTVPVRFVFANPGLVLKPGMYVNVSLSVPLGRQLVIPSSGLLQSGTRQIAFIDRGDGYLQPREVEAGPRLDDHTVILNGLRAGERIVSSANFLLDSESQLQAAVSSFTPPPPSMESTGSTNQPPEMAQVQLSTDPSPPRTGRNSLRVSLTGPDRKPITGAEVTASFFMPAMPAMGMAAMKNVVTLGDKGAGTYRGELQLQSGGTWQVTVLAKRGGKIIASRQLILTASGGMQ